MIRKAAYIKMLYKSPIQFKNICKRYIFTKVISKIYDFHRSIYPTSIIWAVTRNCNYRCSFCIVNDYYMSSNSKSDLELNGMKKIIDKIKRYPVKITLYGGEPLIRTDIFEIMRYLKKSNLEFTIFTNGGLINKMNVDKILFSGTKHISISLDGKKHSKTRGVENALELTLNGIRLLNERKIAYNLSKPTIKLVATITPDFDNEDFYFLFEIAKECKGIDEINLNNLVFDMPETGTKKFNVQRDFLRQFNVKRIKKWYNMNITTFTPRNLLSKDIPNWYSTKHPSKKSSCDAPYNIAFILPEGHLTQCYFMDNPLGNLLKDDLEKIWDGREAISIRKKIKNKEFQKECFRCCLLKPRFD